MLVLILGLVLFIGAHSVRIVADDWRTAMLERLGEGRWKGIYSLVAIVGLVLIVWGYGLARQEPVVLWYPPIWLKHTALLLNLVALIIFVASAVPAGKMKGRIRHPMVISVKVWAFAHLISNETLADVVLFGAFLVWAVLDFRSARQRDRATGAEPEFGPARNDAIAVAVGVVIWAAFTWFLHAWLFGVSPLA